MFLKNRGGGVGEKLYYCLSSSSGDIIYDGERLERDRKLQKLQAEDARNIRDGANFFDLFNEQNQVDDQIDDND